MFEKGKRKVHSMMFCLSTFLLIAILSIFQTPENANAIITATGLGITGILSAFSFGNGKEHKYGKRDKAI